MLRKLVLKDVGPAALLALDPVAPRLNLLTGDNGLGKSFLLEAAWWGLTRTWHSPAVPNGPNARIEHHFDGASKVSRTPSIWNPEGQVWKRRLGRPPNPGLVLYARVDGSFSVWDPARNYRLYKRPDGGSEESPRAYRFDSHSVLEGLKRSVPAGEGTTREEVLCRGLIDDWREWKSTRDQRFDLLVQLLSRLGPDNEPLRPGEIAFPYAADVRGIPTIRMPYGQDVPITYAPAGVQRMAKLAYLLAWALSEHDRQSKLIGQSPSNQVILLLDEIETHLHPRWQRTVLPSLMDALATWRPQTPPRVQILAATHSPLVLASIEPRFDREKDALWKLDLVDGVVQIERDAWHKRGDAQMWLGSDVFDETSAYSVEAEAAMAHASDVMRDPATDAAAADVTRAALLEVLADTDPFWLRWRAWRRSKGWSS